MNPEGASNRKKWPKKVLMGKFLNLFSGPGKISLKIRSKGLSPRRWAGCVSQSGPKWPKILAPCLKLKSRNTFFLSSFWPAVTELATPLKWWKWKWQYPVKLQVYRNSPNYCAIFRFRERSWWSFLSRSCSRKKQSNSWASHKLPSHKLKQ